MVSKSESTISTFCILACTSVEFLILEILSCYKQQCHSFFALSKNWPCNNFEKISMFIKLKQMVFKLRFCHADEIHGSVELIVFGTLRYTNRTLSITGATPASIVKFCCPIFE